MGNRGAPGTPGTHINVSRTWFYGTGIDGNATLDGTTVVNGMALNSTSKTYTMLQPLMLHTLQVASNVTLNTNGYVLWCQHTCALNGTLRSRNITSPPPIQDLPLLFRYPFVALRGVLSEDGTWTVDSLAHTVHLFAATLSGTGNVTAPRSYLYTPFGGSSSSSSMPFTVRIFV
jgi:hypothetical protein